MKKLFTAVLFLFIANSNICAQQAGTEKSLTNNKQFLVDYYQQTLDSLKTAVKGLNAAQLQFKPASDRWSISQCLEHIVLTEQALFDFAKQGMEKAPNPDRRAEVTSNDKDIIRGINDRSFKAKATEDLAGSGKYNVPAEAIRDLQKGRKGILEFIHAASIGDLRNHISDSPFGPIDSYQSFLIVAGHTSRHTLQIQEIKRDSNFPNSKP